MFNEFKTQNELPEQISADLLRMQQELAELTEKFENIYTDAMFQYLPEAEMGDILREWEGRVRSQTSILQFADDIGMSVFGEEVDSQPDFELQGYSRDLRVQFDPSIDLSHKGSNVKGEAQIYGKVRIPAEKPTTKEQLFHFVHYGELHPTVENLAHELIHQYHFDANPETENELGESHAYANGIVNLMLFPTISETAEHIARDYGFPEDTTTAIVRNILLLYANGETTRTVGKMIRSLNPSLKGDWAFKKYCVDPIMQARQTNVVEEDLIVAKYIVSNNIEKTKARILFADLFADLMK